MWHWPTWSRAEPILRLRRRHLAAPVLLALLISGSLAAVAPLFEAARDGPLLTSRKYVNLKTNAGDIHLQLDPGLAPLTCTQLYKLFGNGTYIGTRIPRYEANFVLQVALAEDKNAAFPPVPPDVRAAVRRIPLEVSAQKSGKVKHVKYVLSVARALEDDNSATTSFSILLGNAPHLDHKFTIFGKMMDDATSRRTLDYIASHWQPQKFYIVRTAIMPAAAPAK